MIESLFTESISGTTSLGTAFFYAVIAGVLGLVISLTYMKTGKVSKNFARTLIVLPILVCVVMLVVNGNLGTSVAIVGAFGLIRFRSLQGSSRDIAYIFFSMAVGLTCSVGYAAFGAAITVLVCGVWLLLQALHYGEQKEVLKELRVTIPENLDYSGIFDDLFRKYTSFNRLNRVKTTNMGSLYELCYDVKLLDEQKEKEFLDEIRCRNGNLTIVCGRKDLSRTEEL